MALMVLTLVISWKKKIPSVEWIPFTNLPSKPDPLEAYTAVLEGGTRIHMVEQATRYQHLPLALL